MSRTSRELIELCRGKLGTSYVFNMKRQILAEALLQQLAAENPKVYTSQHVTKIRSFMGKHCMNCSDPTTWCTGILRGSANYRETVREVKSIGTLNKSMTGWALWKPGHIGAHTGNGKRIEAKGINYGTVETRAQDTPRVSVLKLKDIDHSTQICESLDPSSHPTGWVREDGGVRFYLEPERYMSNDRYQGKGQWFRFDGSGYAVQDNWYFYKDNWYCFESDFTMVKGIRLIKGKPYYFNRDGQMARSGTHFTVQMDKNGVLRFPEGEFVENSVIVGRIWGEDKMGMELENIVPDNTEGKTPVLAVYKDSEYTGGTAPPPDTKTEITQAADSKVKQSDGKDTGGTYQTADDRTVAIFILTGDRRTAIRVAAER